MLFNLSDSGWLLLMGFVIFIPKPFFYKNIGIEISIFPIISYSNF